MIWFRKFLRSSVLRPSVPASPTGAAQQLLVSYLDVAGNLLSEVKKTASTLQHGKKLAEIGIKTLEVKADAAKSLYEDAIVMGKLSDTEQRVAKEFSTAAYRYIIGQIREAREWLKQQP